MDAGWQGTLARREVPKRSVSGHTGGLKGKDGKDVEMSCGLICNTRYLSTSSVQIESQGVVYILFGFARRI